MYVPALRVWLVDPLWTMMDKSTHRRKHVVTGVRKIALEYSDFESKGTISEINGLSEYFWPTIGI